MSWLEHLYINANVGDLLAVSADAIVVPIKEGFVPYGKISRALVDRAPAFHAALADARGTWGPKTFGLGDAARLDGARLGLAHARSVIVVAFWTAENRYTVPIVARAITGALRCAFRNNVGTLLMPLIGGAPHAGRPWATNFGLYARGIVQLLHALDELPASDGFPVRQLTFVSTLGAQIEELAVILDEEL